MMDHVIYHKVSIPERFNPVEVKQRPNIIFDSIISREIVIECVNETNDVTVNIVVATIDGDDYTSAMRLVEYYKRKTWR